MVTRKKRHQVKEQLDHSYTQFGQVRQSRTEPNRLRATLGNPNKFWFQTGELNITFKLVRLMTSSTSETKALESRSGRLQQSIFRLLARPVAPNCFRRQHFQVLNA